MSASANPAESWDEFCQAIGVDFDDLSAGFLNFICSAVIRLGADFADPYVLRGSSFAREGRFDEAIADLNRAIQLEPENGVAYFRGAWVYSGLDTSGVCRRMAGAAYCERGRAYFLKGDYGKAIADFNYAIQLSPGNRNSAWTRYIGDRRAAYLKYAFHNMGKADGEQAIAYWSEAIQLDPALDLEGFGSLASAYGIRASEYVAKAEYDKAIVDCFNTVRIDLLRGEARWRREQQQQDEEEDQEKDDEEQDEFGDAVWLNQEHPEADFYRWLSWLCGGQYEEAIADLDEAVRLAPEDGAVHVCRAIVRIAKGDFNAAVADLDAAVRLDPRGAAAHFAAGLPMGARGDTTRR